MKYSLNATFTDTTTGQAAQASSDFIVRSAGLVGASVAPACYGVPTKLAAAQMFDKYVGHDMAMSVERLYFSAGHWQTSPNAPNPLVDMASAGLKRWVVSFQPDPANTQADRNNLQSSIANIQAAGAEIEAVTFYHEVNYGKNNPWVTTTGANGFIANMQYYAPTVLNMGVPMTYIPLITGDTNYKDYFPVLNGVPLVSMIHADFYCPTYANGYDLTKIMLLAQQYGLKFGLGEWGFVTGPTGGTQQSFIDFCGYLRTAFNKWMNEGNEMASCIYFELNSTDLNNVASATDWKVAPIQSFYTSVIQ
jgi:hypothetical protein